ncbi:Protein CBG13175 [Caenorhabditis briggsae]|uniref:Protein CBG13175 n=1 Tax=Caenorhabditis briggsae TaxID=6238 RepID=A8XH83_CAEBR|nr:Protein CBG13175 [Caenorhabditis briggsae]CAP32007.2 Protein CBG13175 [Caenorhabditis briggsae]
MNDSWFRRSNGTSSGSSSIGTQGLFGNGSFDAMMPFNTDFSFFVNNKNNNKPSVKLLPLSNRRTSSLANNNLTPDSGSFFFNGTPSEDTFFPLDRGQNSFVASSEFAEPARTEITLQNVVKFDRSVVTDLIKALHSSDLVDICTDQTSIHAMQRIRQVRMSARQQVIDRLSENSKAPCFNARLQLLHTLMSCVVRNCYRLSSNEFANYVVQYAIKSSGIMEMYRDMIIDKCLLRNLLSMSQDKYASHVIEGAFIFAPPSLLTEMMTEIFDGYVKDHGTNRDALDILLFHQYGNYVVQQMITICTSALMGKEERRLSPSDLGMYAAWYEKIRCRVERHSSRLERFSSGKKIIDSLQKLPSITSPKPLPPRDLSLLEMTAQLDVMFPSFLSNPLMF